MSVFNGWVAEGAPDKVYEAAYYAKQIDKMVYQSGPGRRQKEPRMPAFLKEAMERQ